MSEPDDGRTIRDARRPGESGTTDVVAPDTVRDSGLPVGVPSVGETIADKYVVERVIGQGGMGQVLAVRHSQLGNLYAMKVLDPELVDDEDARARFGREARAMAALTSAHSVRVHDVAELPNKLPYLVMDYLDGEDLGRLMRRRGELPVDEAVSYIDQACEALEEAHAAGLVHRDLKPQNLFLAKDAKGKETLRVLDFGIARAFGGKLGKLQTITRHGDVLGTLEYMAPEQIRSAKSVDPRTDVWALGACLYRFLTNARPFVSGGGEGGLVEAILTKEPPPIREVRSDVPPAIVFVVERCLKKSPADRFQTVSELRAALKLAAATNEIPPDDGTVPMINAPVRPPPRKSERPTGTLPMPKVDVPLPKQPSAPAPAPSGPAIPPSSPSGPSLARVSAPTPMPMPSTPPSTATPSSKTPIVVLGAVVLGIVIVIVAVVLRSLLH